MSDGRALPGIGCAGRWHYFSKFLSFREDMYTIHTYGNPYVVWYDVTSLMLLVCMDLLHRFVWDMRVKFWNCYTLVKKCVLYA